MKRRRLILFITAAAVVVGFILFKRLYPAGRLRLPAGNQVPQLSLGFAHGLVIAPDGSLWSWGAEDLGWPVLGYGQTNGAPAFSPVLRRISPATNWVKVSAGQDHNLALKSDGTIWTWGANYAGQLGFSPARMRMQSSPIPSAPGNDWADMVAASVCSYALKKDGSLWAWGVNNFCQLGIGTVVATPIAVQVGSATNWAKIRAGGVSAAGIQSDGSLWIWGGSTRFGNSAVGQTNNLAMPTRVTDDTNWVDVAVDYNIWLAVKSDGTLWAFGKDGRLLTYASPSTPGTPAQIGTNTDWVSVSAGGFPHLLRKRDGTFWKLTRAYADFELKMVRQLGLPKDAIGGDTGGGAVVAVTLDGEVWAQGAVLGERTSKDRLLEMVSKLGLRGAGGPAEKVYRDKPWPVRNIEPGDPPK